VVEDDRSREEGKERNDMMASESFPPFYPEPSKNGRIKTRHESQGDRADWPARVGKRHACYAGRYVSYSPRKPLTYANFVKLKKKWNALTARNI
jgi:hypothetical protein